MLGINIIPRRKTNSVKTPNKDIIKEDIKYCVNCGAILSDYATKYCCVKCQGQHKHKQAYLEYLKAPASIMRAN